MNRRQYFVLGIGLAVVALNWISFSEDEKGAATPHGAAGMSTEASPNATEPDYDAIPPSAYRSVQIEAVYEKFFDHEWDEKHYRSGSPLEAFASECNTTWGDQGIPQQRLKPEEVLALVRNQDDNGMTTLLYLAQGPSYASTKRCAEILLRLGADPNHADDSDTTALLYAANGYDHDLVELLLKYGAEVDHQDEHGRSALMFAINRQDADMVKRLLAAGADPDLSTSWGSSNGTLGIAIDSNGLQFTKIGSPRDLARLIGDEKVSKLLDDAWWESH